MCYHIPLAYSSKTDHERQPKTNKDKEKDKHETKTKKSVGATSVCYHKKGLPRLLPFLKQGCQRTDVGT